MGTRYPFGDFGERRIARARIFEALLCHGDRVRAAVPLSD